MSGTKTSRIFLLFSAVFFLLWDWLFFLFFCSNQAKFEVNFPNSKFLGWVFVFFGLRIGDVAVFYPKKCQNTFAFRKNVALGAKSTGEGSDLNALRGIIQTAEVLMGNRIKICGCCSLFGLHGLAFRGNFSSDWHGALFLLWDSFPLANFGILLVGRGQCCWVWCNSFSEVM